MSLGSKIRLLRFEHAMSQGELGKITKIPQTTISDWENSKTIPNVEEANKIAKALGVTISELLEEEIA